MQVCTGTLRRPALGTALLLSVLASSAAAQTARLRVELEGVGGPIRANIRSVLSISAAAREGQVAVERIRRLHARAPGEIRLALQPFGYYRAQVETELRAEGDRFLARYRIDPGPLLRIARISLKLRGDGADDAQLREAADRFPLREGDPLRHGDHESGKTALARRAADRGYLDATFATSEIRIDLEAYTRPRSFWSSTQALVLPSAPSLSTRTSLTRRCSPAT